MSYCLWIPAPWAMVAERQEAILFSGPDLAREDYAHLHARRTLKSLAYVPFMVDSALIGVMEIASFDSPLTDDDLGDTG